MESLGEYLRRERESRGISLREISDKTRIGINYLRYIETDQFKKIPGDIFVKGFLRLYVNSVGLQEEEILEKYNALYKGEEKKKIDKEIVKDKHRKLPSWLWAIPIILLTIILFNVLPKKKVPVPPIPKPVNNLIKQEASPVSSQDIPEKLTLSIEAIEETWIKVLIDGKEVREALLGSGESISFTGEKNFGLTIGNAGGVKIKLDGKELDSLGPRGKVIRNLVLTREGKSLSPVISNSLSLPSPSGEED